MAKGVKNIKRLSNSLQPDDYFNSGDIICINPDQEAKFIVGEWYNETTEEERRNTAWLWMDQKKRKTFNKITKPSGVFYGVTLPKKLCGIYAFYLEASLDGQHGQRNTGVYVFGKCENKITSSSWSKKENTADNSEINYGDKLFITLETEGLNGNTLTIELYSVKNNDALLESEKANCIDGTIEATFKMKSVYKEFPGMPGPVENFYIKVKAIGNKEEYIKDATGNDKILSFNIIKTDSIITIPVFQAPTNTTPLKIDNTPQEEEIKTEGIISAYFAKEEFSLETSEIDGQHEYIFKNPNVNINKDKIAKIIKDLVDAKVKADKKYAKLEDIKNALTEDSYDKGRSVSFNLCKLGAKFIKVNSAPLEEEVYVVAKTFLLDGKEVNITIKEKETYLVDENTAVPVLEAKEDGTELTTLKATVENGLAKVKVKLRPKADEDLKIWKEKLLKGKKEGTYNYTFKSEKTTIDDNNKKQLATLILNNAKEGKQGNTKIETGKIAFVEDLEKALESKTYIKGDTISFDLYKTQTESLWLKADCQGDTEKHEGEFLKRDGEYFVIGKKCECEARVRAFMRMLRVGEGTGELIKSYDYNKKETIYIPHDFQKGYTTAFGGNEITDLSTHPNKVYKGGSSAAGAYQIMGYTYAWLGGSKLEWTGKYFKILDIYESYHDYRKTYNIIDFQPESQDKLCICLMKDKKGMLQLIIDNKIEDAIRKYGSSIYASLPCEGDNSKYELNGKPQPATPMNICLSHYEKFLKEELADKSNLHLKKGFLKDFKIECCNMNEIKPVEGKGWNIDIHLWSNRKDMGYGILVLKNDSNQEVWRTIVRAQGYTNKIGGSRTEQYADTPTGIYKFESWRNDGSSQIYGSNHRLDMTYESGEAKAVGREEIQIHGGRQANDSNPYLWNTGGCLRVFDDAIITLKKKVEILEEKSNEKEDHLINVNHTLKYDTLSKKYFTPDDYLEIIKDPENEDVLKKGITNKKYYKNESNYYTDNLTD